MPSYTYCRVFDIGSRKEKPAIQYAFKMVINNGFFLHNTTINHSAYQIEATGTRYHCHQCGKENNQCTYLKINVFFISKYVQSGRQIGEVLHCFRNGEDGVFSVIFITVTDLPFLNRRTSGSRYPSPAILTVKKNVPDQAKISDYDCELPDRGNRRRFYHQKR